MRKRNAAGRGQPDGGEGLPAGWFAAKRRSVAKDRKKSMSKAAALYRISKASRTTGKRCKNLACRPKKAHHFDMVEAMHAERADWSDMRGRPEDLTVRQHLTSPQPELDPPIDNKVRAARRKKRMHAAVNAVGKSLANRLVVDPISTLVCPLNPFARLTVQEQLVSSTVADKSKKKQTVRELRAREDGF